MLFDLHLDKNCYKVYMLQNYLFHNLKKYVNKLGLIYYNCRKDIFLRNSELVEGDKDFSKICIQNFLKFIYLLHLKCVVEAAL